MPDLSATLLNLYELTKIDSELAEIDEEKGDLPNKIFVIKNEIDEIKTKIEINETSTVNLKEEEEKLLKENEENEEKMGSYDNKKYSVKNNKEYDEIMKSIDMFMDKIEKNESRLKEIKSVKEKNAKELEELSTKLEEMNKDLEESQKNLDELNTQYENDELELNDKRTNITARLSDDVKSLYERINGSMRGEATALVRKGNCSGCYNSVPPQREIEIKMATEIFTCQSCGRILINEDLIPKQ